MENPKYHDEFLELWNQIHEQTDDASLNEMYIKQSQLMGQFAAINNQFIAIYNSKKQNIIYLSDNFLDVLGYKCTEEEYKKWSSLYWMRDIPLEQSWFFLRMSLFFRNTVQPILKKSSSKKLNWFIHNFRLSPPNSDLHHVSILGNGLEFQTDGSMIILMTIIKDVGELIKDKDTWWAEFRVNDEEVFHFHHQEKKFKNGSILSDREKGVLTLIEQGKETKAIAEWLEISPHTVDKHRKNMLEFTGAKDTSMLLQICQMGRLI